MSEYYTRVAGTNEIPSGGVKQVSVEGQPVALFRHQGRFYAIHDGCLHRGGPLSEGFIKGSVVSCPWHAWDFDFVSGRCLNAPHFEVRRYAVKVEDGAVFVSKSPVTNGEAIPSPVG